MDCLTSDMNFIFLYLNDVLVYSKSKEEHIRHLNILFKSFKEYGFIMNPYDGPNKVIERGAKTFKIEINGKIDVVSVDRLKSVELLIDLEMLVQGEKKCGVQTRD